MYFGIEVCEWGGGRFKVVGVRAEESKRRANRSIVETDKDGSKILNVIHEWLSTDIWEYIHTNKLPYCKLYDEGYTRIGCVLCPNARKSVLMKDLERYPSIVKMYRDACRVAYDKRIAGGGYYKDFKHGDDIFKWWITEILLHNFDNSDKGQLSLFEESLEDEKNKISG